MTKKNRSIKVIGQSGYKYKETATIMLKGKWLEELGFEIGNYVTVRCENGKLIITPNRESGYGRSRGSFYGKRSGIT